MLTALLANAPQPPQELPPFWQNPLFVMTLGMMFLFIVIMPMAGRRQRREQAAMLAQVKRGAKVVTSGGIIGTVVTAKDGEDEITIRSEDTKLRITRGAVSRVLGHEETDTK